MEITKRQNQLLKIIYNCIKTSGYPPTFKEIRQKLKVSSNQAVIDLLAKLSDKKFIKKESKARSIVILPAGYKVLGVGNNENLFLAKISGKNGLFLIEKENRTGAMLFADKSSFGYKRSGRFKIVGKVVSLYTHLDAEICGKIKKVK